MNRIKKVLKEKGISQTWLADKMGKKLKIKPSKKSELIKVQDNDSRSRKL